MKALKKVGGCFACLLLVTLACSNQKSLVGVSPTQGASPSPGSTPGGATKPDASRQSAPTTSTENTNETSVSEIPTVESKETPLIVPFSPAPPRAIEWSFLQLLDPQNWELQSGCLGRLTESFQTALTADNLMKLGGLSGKSCQTEELLQFNTTGVTDQSQLSGNAQLLEGEGGVWRWGLVLRASSSFVYPGVFPQVNLFLQRTVNLKQNPQLTLQLKSLPFFGHGEKVKLQITPQDVNGLRPKSGSPIIEVGATLSEQTLDFSNVVNAPCVNYTVTPAVDGSCDLTRVRSLIFHIIPMPQAKPVTLNFVERAANVQYEAVSLTLSAEQSDFSQQSAVRLKIKNKTGTGHTLRLDLADDQNLSTNSSAIELPISDTGTSTLDFDFSGKFFYRDYSQNPLPAPVPVKSTSIRGWYFFLNPGSTRTGEIELLEASKGRIVNGVFEADTQTVPLCRQKADWYDPNSRVSCDPTLRWAGQINVLSLRQKFVQPELSSHSGAKVLSRKLMSEKNVVNVDCRVSQSTLQPGQVASCGNVASGQWLSFLKSASSGKCYVKAAWEFRAGTCPPLAKVNEIECDALLQARTARMRMEPKALTWWFDKNDNGVFEEDTELLLKHEPLPIAPSSSVMASSSCEVPLGTPQALGTAQAALEFKRSDDTAHLCPESTLCPLSLAPLPAPTESSLKVHFVKVRAED